MSSWVGKDADEMHLSSVAVRCDVIRTQSIWSRRRSVAPSSLWLGVLLSLWTGSALPETMHVDAYLEAIHQKRLVDPADDHDFMQMLRSASVDTITAASSHLIARGTADPEALAYAYAQRSRFWRSSTHAWAAAVADREQAVQLSTQCKPFYLVRLGEILADRNWASAMSYFDQAITVGPRDPYVFFRRARLHREAHDMDLALRDLEEVIRLVPHRPAAYIQRAEIRRVTGDLDRALQDYHAAFERADSQLIKNTQWSLLGKKLYRGTPDGSNNELFRTAVSACVKDATCTVIEGWSANTSSEHP